MKYNPANDTGYPIVQLSAFDRERPRDHGAILERLAARLGIAAPGYRTQADGSVAAVMPDLAISKQSLPNPQEYISTPSGHGATQAAAAEALWRALLPITARGQAVVHYHTPAGIWLASF